MGDRVAAEAFIHKFIKEIDPSGYNTEQYNKIFKNMSDKEFDIYMKDIRDKKKFLVIFKPLYEAKGITTENNIAVAKKYGLSFFEHLIYSNNKEGPDYKTPIEYLVIDLPYRRQSQTLVKKVSIPENNKTIEERTYQPTGASKGGKLSYPEVQVLMGMGLTNTINELARFRGGDKGGFNAYNSMILKYGSANLSTLDQFTTGVESTKTLNIYLKGMHINTNL